MPAALLEAAAVRAWAIAGRDALAAAREEIDELNVYPVPDGDTGTNLHLTVAAAVAELDESAGTGCSAGRVLAVLAHGALLGARGNSGVILSQVFRGLSDAVGDDAVDGARLATALGKAATAAYEAVGRPVEGTMLTVTRVAAEAAAGAGTELGAVVVAAADGAREALARTPEQLEVLRRAGVVDAGGRGVCVLLDALQEVVTGSAPVPGAVLPAVPVAPSAEPESDPEDAGDGPAYEVMFLLDAPA
ncbi:MAG: fatty acid kinase, partial [Actinomycetota bacterium]|nr:fatty acid kinase [Actinomycetota bacterium]